MHDGGMAEQQYLTVRGVATALFAAALDRLRCVRRGHDPLLVSGEKMCRRCYGSVR